MKNFTIASGSLTGGHPDKLCDRISDAVVDGFLRVDQTARIDVECAISAGVVFCACHTSSRLQIDVAAVARRVIADTGYRVAELDPGSLPVMVTLSRLPERGVKGERGPEGVLSHNVTTFGYATADTTTGLPLPIHLAHRLARGVDELRAGRPALELHPDAQVQAVLRYVDRQPVALDGITFLVGMGPGDEAADVVAVLQDEVVPQALKDSGVAIDRRTQILVNPPGADSSGGPARHAGVTGRKLGVDTYGDFTRQPSSALSGKDPGRVDRLATYAARYAARNLVAAGLARECEVQLCYVVGRPDPVSVEVDSFTTGALSDEQLSARLRRCLDLRPAALEARFQLRRRAAGASAGYFEPLALFGHVGRADLAVPWEATDLTQALAGST